MAGLFTVTPQSVQMAQAEKAAQQGLQRANLAPGRGMVAAAGQGGAFLGEGVSKAFGGQSPEMQKAQKLQQLQSTVEASGIDITTNPREFLAFAGKTAQEMGLMDEAMQISEQLRAIPPEEKPKFGEFGQDIAQLSATYLGIPFSQQTQKQRAAVLEINRQNKLAEKEAGASSVSVINDTSSKEEIKSTIGKLDEAEASSVSAQNSNDVLDSVAENLKGFTTGPLGNARLTLSKWGDFLGVPINLQSNASGEAIDSASTQLTLEGTKVLKGAISDREIKMIKESMPGLLKTNEGNLKLIDLYKKVNNRRQERAVRMNEFVTKYGGLRPALLGQKGVKSFTEEWTEYVNNNPLFGPKSADKSISEMTDEELQAIINGK